MSTTAELEPLAVVGLAFKLPQDATSPDKLWRILEQRKCASKEMPPSRINIDGHYHQDASRVDNLNLRGAHFLSGDIAAFDAPFFSISPSEAAAMDPQQRGLLETSYHALENAGIPMESVSGTDTAVFTGSFGDDHKIISLKDPERLSRYAGSSTAFSILANRLSWWFNFKGPSMNVDTACSSSLVGLHLACQSLRSKECSMALVAGSNILSSVEQYLLMSNLSMLGPDSRSYSFDHRANGYARGEGIGVVVVKRLSDALNNHDVIRAVIRATGTNQDGRTPNLTSPSQQAQEELIRDTYRKAGLDPAATAFVEAHGTGTPVGDPIEANALGSVFCANRSPQDPLYIGSVKSNIGHLEGGSGIAGLIKAILALERGVIPPNANFEEPNPSINTDKLNIAFPVKPVPWPSTGLRRASVNSFGFGGSNSHVVLEDACSFLKARRLHGHHLSVELDNRVDSMCPSPSPEGTDRPSHVADTKTAVPKLLILSASDSQACARVLQSYTDFFSTQREASITSSHLDEVAYTLAKKRSVLSSRVFAVAQSSADLSNLSKLASKPIRVAQPRDPGFIFTGQGAQYSKMGAQLLDYPIFKKSMDNAAAYFRRKGASWNLLEELAKPEKETRVHSPEFSQPMCTALQVALIDLLRSFGVRPHLVVGHSSGEIAAAYCIGALDCHSALKIAYFRGQVAATVKSGAMLAVGLSEACASRYVEEYRISHPEMTIVIACINSPTSVTLAGNAPAILAIKAKLDADGVFARKLKVSVAYHSPHMNQLSRDYRDFMGYLYPGSESLSSFPSMISSVTGHQISPSQLLDPGYWVQNMVSPVRFSDAVTEALRPPGSVDTEEIRMLDMLEIGPHCALKGPVKDIISSLDSSATVHYESVLRRTSEAATSCLAAMGHLHCLGHPVDICAVNGFSKHAGRSIQPLTDLPPYPFDHSKSYWHESRRSQHYRLHRVPRSDLLGAPVSADGPPQMAKRWRKITRVSETPWVIDHVVNGSCIYSAAGMLTMAIEAASQVADRTREVSAYGVEQAEFLRPIPIRNDQDGVESQIELTPWRNEGDSSSTASFSICTLEEENWVENCRGIVRIDYKNEYAVQDLSRTDLLGVQYPTRNLNEEQVYDAFNSMGLTFGPTFRSLEDIVASSDFRARSTIKAFDPEASGSGYNQNHVIHPITLDGIFQTILVALTQSTRENFPTAVPTKIEDLWVAEKGAACESVPKLQVSAKIDERSAQSTTASARAQDEEGNIRVYIARLQTTFIDSVAADLQEQRSRDICYHISWKPDIDFFEDESRYTIQGSGTFTENEVIHEAQHHEDLALLFSSICTKTINKFDQSEIDGTRAYLQYYYNWMKEHLDRYTATGDFSDQALHIMVESAESFSDLSKKASAFSASGRGVVETGKHLPEILRGEKDPLELIFQSNVAENYYQEANKRTERALGRIMELLAFKNPGMKVLEIGAGTGSTTNLILKHTQIHQHGNDSFSAVSSYEFTDISASFFAAAKEKFNNYSSKMKYSVLDCSKDPIAQGFREAHYDVIIAANVLHATPDLNVTISNARRILKPGGKLVLLEITENQWIPQIIFGTLPGWWLSNDEYRKPGEGPCIPSSLWDQVFRRNGFSGTDIVVRDAEDPRCRICSVMVTTAVQQDMVEGPGMVILADKEDNETALHVRQSLSTRLPRAVEIISMQEAVSYDFSEKFCISLLETRQPVLATVDKNTFTTLRKILTTSNKVLWVHGSLDSSPEFNLVEGLFRVLRSENEHVVYATLATGDIFSTQTIQNIAKVAEAMSISGRDGCEPEYREKNGALFISRAMPATEINYHIQQAITQGTEPAAQERLSEADIDSSNILDPKATYVVAGGFGGVARSICRWMVDRGARNLILLSRSGPKSSAAQDLLLELSLQGVKVECPACDLALASDVREALDSCLAKLPPVKGCIQGALVLQDSIFERMTHKQWDTTLSPRIKGTQNLHYFLPNLSFFILLSSVNGVIGNPSQGNYAATNTYLDAFAHHHFTPTSPVISIDVGWVDFAGTVAESEEIQKRLANLGCLTPLAESEMLGLLDYYCDPKNLAQGVPPQTIMGIKRSEAPGPNLLDRPLWRNLRLFEAKHGSTTGSAAVDAQAQVPTCSLLSKANSVSEASRIVLDALTAKLAADLGLENDAIRRDKPLHENGVDSLMVVQLRGWFRSEIGANVTVFDIMGNLSLENVCKGAAEKSSWVTMAK